MRRQHIIKQSGGLLPAGYTQLDYIEATGTQWIKTNITGVNQDWHYIHDITLLSTGLFGLRGLYNVRDNDRIAALIGHTTGRIDYVCGGTGYKTTTTSLPRNARYIIYDYKDKFVIDGIEYPKTYANITSSAELMLLAFNVYGNESSGHYGRLHHEEVYDDNDNIVLFGYSALRDYDSKPGLYDIVNDVFYTNNGTGEFLYA